MPLSASYTPKGAAVLSAALWWLLLPTLVLPALAATEVPQSMSYAAQGYPERGQVNVLAQQIVNELLLTNDVLTPTQPVVVATPVSVTDFDSTGEFGRTLQQSLISALHARYFNVVDVSLSRSLRVTQQGDFYQSRDWQKLSDAASAGHVLIADYSLGRDGITINSRIVDVGNARVVATSQAFASPSTLNDFLEYSPKVVSKGGLLYRYEAEGMASSQLLGEDK